MIRLRDVRLRFSTFELHVPEGVVAEGITGIFGPSGAGKTTLLEIIAGIRPPDSAFIEVNGMVLTDTERKIQVPVERRAIGYVPQDLALFPHLNVRQNLLFGVRGNAPNGTFDHIVKVLEIESLLSRRVTNLSGGEKQRIAFARALLAKPQLMMLDEPLASLDRPLKEAMSRYLLQISNEFKTPILYVSHDRDEIIQLCSSVIVMKEGRVVALGSPADLI